MPLIKEHSRQYDIVVFGATGEFAMRVDHLMGILITVSRLHGQVIG